MASRRKLKKAIDYIVDDIYSECLYSSLQGSVPTETWLDLMRQIVSMRNDYVARISHVEPGCSPKLFFEKLVSSFEARANEILKNIAQAQKQK